MHIEPGVGKFLSLAASDGSLGLFRPLRQQGIEP